ncbi:MAG: hypothetical protein RR206_03835 [Bacteroidaceae bacterium]
MIPEKWSHPLSALREGRHCWIASDKVLAKTGHKKEEYEREAIPSFPSWQAEGEAIRL